MDISTIVNRQRSFFNTNKTKSISFRRLQLLKLKDILKDNEQKIYDALYLDLNKSEYETYLTELGIVYSEINVALKNLNKWTKPKRVNTPISNFPGKSFYIYEPYGVTLILSPWNYPFQLAIAPLVGSMAAGNTALIKGSQHSFHTSKLLKEIINNNFEEEYLYFIDSEDYDNILDQHYDYIFFTGSKRVGSIVMQAASKYVTPISLELGGKSPTFVDVNSNLDLAAKRIIWGKCLNSGQTCVAPDYVLVDKRVHDELINKMQFWIKKMYHNPLENKNYPKIISEHHYDRLKDLLKNQDKLIGGKFDDCLRKIEPTIIPNCDYNNIVMQEEIFGPILPIISYEQLDYAINKVKENDKPLATYIFSNDQRYIDTILNDVSFGGGCVNDIIMHLANHNLPFGGVGGSGMGMYHGKASFTTFSHTKSVQRSYTFMDVSLRYPKFTNKKLNIIKKLLK